MSKFRKKPIEVEAVQWDGPWHKLPGVVFEESLGGDPEGGGERVRFYVVTAHEQPAYLAPSDWVVTEASGDRHYPVKDAIFRATFDPIG